jgi:hypothetical protein
MMQKKMRTKKEILVAAHHMAQKAREVEAEIIQNIDSDNYDPDLADELDSKRDNYRAWVRCFSWVLGQNMAEATNRDRRKEEAT